ncbi:efflux RND transporter periplasmic adaptor subunit [Pannonibacter sp. Q-1]|uniref:efflux RND transporter periplasmic adaptor subunit n=1 Tax=Pannonibacter TaxID=227873 RepID=UPI00067C3DC1|nr:efflux RND transporter periplasmic adaptor subunit [Pannonibacter phragmitetus]KND17363.1 hemolysin secretion protein D [Pannonibacter phragmitetus]
MRRAASLSFLLLAGFSLAACEPHEAEEAAPVRPVLSVRVEEAPATRLTLPGTVAARVETDYGFRVLGRIVTRDVQTADIVRKGDVLATIDPVSLELAVKSAQSDLVNANAQLSNAITTEARQKTLFERQSGALATFETAEQDRKIAEAAVARAKANLDKAQEQLGYARLLAEFDGVVTGTSAEVGQVVTDGQTVVTVAKPDERDAVIDVPEEASGTLKPGAVFGVALQLDPRVQAKGIVREIGPEADGATRTRRVRLTLVDPPEALRLGAVIMAFADVHSEARFWLPASAIRAEGDARSVWVVDEAAGKVVSRKVSVDETAAQGGRVAVLQGLEAGDRVVVAGVNMLTEGQAIRVDQETVK